MRRNDWRFTDETLTGVIAPGRGGRALGQKKQQGMNKTETRYAEQLELRRQVGELVWWQFEGLTFRLGERCYYTPDFDVMMADYQLHCIDVKGTQTKTRKSGDIYETDYTEDDARVKIATASSMYPLRFFLAYEDATGNWVTREVGG